MDKEAIMPHFFQVSQFWTAISTLIYAITAILLFQATWSISATRGDGASSSVVTVLPILLAAGIASGFGLYRSKRKNTPIPLVYTCAPATLAVLLHWVLTPITPGPPLEGHWIPYWLWAAPAALASASGALAYALKRTRDATSRESAEPPPALPLISTTVAILFYGEVGFAAFSLTAGFSTDYMPVPVIVIAVALSLPLPLLVIGFSAAIASRIHRAVPLLAVCTVILFGLLLTLTVTFSVWGFLIFVAAAVPLAWPTYRSFRIVRAEYGAETASAQPPEDLAR